VDYRKQRVDVTARDLRDWTLDHDTKIASGPCPACGDNVQYEYQPDIVVSSGGFLVKPSSPDDGTPRTIPCNCGQVHVDSAKVEHQECGRSWVVRVMPEGSHPALIPEQDPVAKALADQIAEYDRKSELTMVRAAADKWVAGVTALLGLLGLSGIAFGKDAFTDLTTTARIVLIVILVIAVVTAAWAVVSIYRAAYGWPRTLNASNLPSLKRVFKLLSGEPGDAAGSLRRGVHAALLALVLLCAGAGVVAFGGGPKPQPVKATFADDSIVCGKLLDSAVAGTVRIRKTDGTVVTADSGRLAKLEAGAKC
jgi:hypothetical protein